MKVNFLKSLRVRWRVLIVVVYSLSALSFALPRDVFPLKSVIGSLTTAPMAAFGLWQYWDMFAPTPRSDDIKVELVYKTADGNKYSIFVTDMMAMGYMERWRKERWRKYFNDNLRTDAKKYLWAPFAAYFYKELKQSGVEAIEIELRRHWRSAKRLVSPSLRADRNSEPWNSYSFYVWRPEKLGISPSFGG